MRLLTLFVVMMCTSCCSVANPGLGQVAMAAILPAIWMLQIPVVMVAAQGGHGGGGSRRYHRFVDWINPNQVPPTSVHKQDSYNQESLERHTSGRRSSSGRTASTKGQDDIDDRPNDVQTLFIEQKLDHFRLSDSRTFAQRFFYSDRFVVTEQQQPLVQDDRIDEIPFKANAAAVSLLSQKGRHRRRRRREAQQDSVKAESFSSTSLTTYAFLCVGGEGPALDSSVLVDSVHCTGDMLELASHLFHNNMANVHLFALEHRYYGKSYPVFSSSPSNNPNHTTIERTSPVSNENLVYLSSRQALSDIAHFVSVQTQSLSRSSNNNNNNNLQWVTFGGSYPGMLAAWARYRFPHLITAAVSSSAPLQTQLDFVDYKNHVAKALQLTDIGGSTECWEIVQQGHKQLSNIFQNPDKDNDPNKSNKKQWIQVARDFHLCNATTIFDPDSSNITTAAWNNIAVFLGDGVFYVGAQENDPSCTQDLCNIAKKCEYLMDSVHVLGSTPLQSLVSLVDKLYNLTNTTDCVDVSWNNVLNEISNITWPKERAGDDDDGLRSWLWQTCTEFGYYQTCNVGSQCPFAQGWHTLDQDLEICEHAFAVPPAQVRQAVQETLEYYGGWNLSTSATRILSVNGQVDPWSELALLPSINPSNKDPNMPTLMVSFASHHFWTHPIKDTDSPQVMAARQFIYSTVIQWLQDGQDENKESKLVS